MRLEFLPQKEPRDGSITSQRRRPGSGGYPAETCVSSNLGFLNHPSGLSLMSGPKEGETGHEGPAWKASRAPG